MSWSCFSFEAVAKLVEDRVGFRLKPEVSSGSERLLRDQMARVRLSSEAEYLQLIQDDRVAFEELVDAATISETYFFRHSEQFDRILKTILPEIRRLRGQSHLLRVWSAACSTGEEAYSLAILFREAGWGNQNHLVASDISHTSLQDARRAVYRKWSFRGSGATRALPYFRKEESDYFLSQPIRNAVTFRRLNLAQPCFPDPSIGLDALDLILCRNVMIYFGRDTIKSLAVRMFDSLAPGGYLLTAPTDPPIESYAPFEKEIEGDVVVHRRPTEERAKSVPVQWRKSGKKPSREFNEKLFPASPDEPARCDELFKAHQRSLEAINSEEVCSPAAHPSGGQSDELCHSQSIVDAESAFKKGDYERAFRLTESLLDCEAAAALHLRSVANISGIQAEAVSEKLLDRYPLSLELHYLRATILMETGNRLLAEKTLQRLAFLDPPSPLAHFSMATLRHSQGDLAGAKQCYQQAAVACRSLSPDDLVPFSPGETVSSLADAAKAQIGLLS